VAICDDAVQPDTRNANQVPGMVNVERTTLLHVITRPKKLVSLNLWKVCITLCDSNGQVNVTSLVNNIADLPTMWNVLLTELIEALPATSTLTSMLIGFPAEVVPVARPKPIPIRFGFTEDPNVSIQTASYRGPDLKQWLEETAARTARVIDFTGYSSDEFSSSEVVDEEDDDDLDDDSIPSWADDSS